MGRPTPTGVKPQFGDPVEELANETAPRTSTYWGEVARHARLNPDQWIPLLNCPVSLPQLRAIVWNMDKDDRQENRRVPAALKDHRYQTRVIDNQFWFRFNVKPKVIR